MHALNVTPVTPVNKTPLLPCFGCGNKWIVHDYSHKEKATQDGLKVNVIFVCRNCNTARVFGQEG